MKVGNNNSCRKGVATNWKKKALEGNIDFLSLDSSIPGWSEPQV